MPPRSMPHRSIRRIDPASLAERLLIDTHILPLDFLASSLKETVGAVVLVGIQPARTRPGMLPSPDPPSFG